MNVMSHIQNNSPRPAETPPKTAGEAGRSPKRLEQQAKSPRVREQSGSPKKPLFSPSSPSLPPSRQTGCIPAASPRATRSAPNSPYKTPPSQTGKLASDPLPALRAYLQGLKPDSLSTGILRDQTTATAEHYPAAWIRQIQASLAAPLGKLRELAPAILAAMPANDPAQLSPDAGNDAGFDWTPFGKACAKLWPEFAGRIISLESLPPRTVGLLAEFHAELAALPAFANLAPEARNKAQSDALFNLLIWNGIFSPLAKSYPEQYQRLVNGLCTYVKAAWGMQALTRGSMGRAIAAMVPAEQVKQCAAFQTALATEVEALAARRTVKFQDRHRDPALNNLRVRNIERHFADTWLTRADDYARVVKQGNYYLADADGVERRCKSYADLRKFVGSGSRNSLPEVVLHVAGDRIRNFLCNTYLYDPEKPLFTDAQGQRVDPVPDLETKFILSRSDNGAITVTFSCVDPAVKAAMRVAPGHDDTGVDATPLFQASLEFHGDFHFHPNEEFEAGSIRLAGQNLHMFE
jgi:hypothetical protein